MLWNMTQTYLQAEDTILPTITIIVPDDVMTLYPSTLHFEIYTYIVSIVISLSNGPTNMLGLFHSLKMYEA